MSGEAAHAHELMRLMLGHVVDVIGPDSTKLRGMCDTVRLAKVPLLVARGKARELEETDDTEKASVLRAEIDALRCTAVGLCRADRLDLVTNQIVKQVTGLGTFENRVIFASVNPDNVHPGHVATFSEASVGLDLTPGKFDLCEGNLDAANGKIITLVDFDPLSNTGAEGAGIFSDGPAAAVLYCADASRVADSTKFKLNSAIALCREAQKRAIGAGPSSRRARAARVWLAIVSFLEANQTCPDANAKFLDCVAFFDRPEFNTTAAAVVHTACTPSLLLLEAIESAIGLPGLPGLPGIKKGDITAFSMSCGAAAHEMSKRSPDKTYFALAVESPPTSKRLKLTER